ncbi:MAG: succinate dehydrogenase [Chlamydiia bacterium]|nr:succinate dehydrogenase [Chlamydiia bacterium]MCB1114921.1 succinate dehydrogenase [Chlamydiia bacterium]
MSVKTASLPRPFAFRRIHSLFGLWIVIFLMEHLLTNSQAALMIGDSGEGFIRAVNFLKNLPYLHVIEVVLLGVPILYHMVFGIHYLFTSKMNAYSSGGNKPALKKYGRNHAYSWQRITSWILLVGMIAHVGYMRFYMYPEEVEMGEKQAFFVRVTMDPGLYTVSDRLGVKLYNQSGIEQVRKGVESHAKELDVLSKQVEALQERDETVYRENIDQVLAHYQSLEEEKAYLKGLEKRKISKGQVIAEASNFGTATLLIVRDSFKSVFKSILYTIFVLAAVFHAFNGLWTFMITWGIVLKMRSQSVALNVCKGIMLLVGFLGLIAVWGTYYLNLRT